MTAVVGLVLLGLQGMLSAFFEVRGRGRACLGCRVGGVGAARRAGRPWPAPVAGPPRCTGPPPCRPAAQPHRRVQAGADRRRRPRPLRSLQDDPNARGLHAYFGSAILALFVAHAGLGLQLGLSLS